MLKEQSVKNIHPDTLEDLREEARLNVLELVKGGDIPRKDGDEALQQEFERLVTRHHPT